MDGRGVTLISPLLFVPRHLIKARGLAQAPPNSVPLPLPDDDGVGGAGRQVPDVDHPPGHVTCETRACRVYAEADLQIIRETVTASRGMEDAEAGEQSEAGADQGPDPDTGLQVGDIAKTLAWQQVRNFYCGH